MLGHWLFVRIRTAEKALDEGRIDEAYLAAVQPDIRKHRRGQKLLDNLVRPLLARARLQLQAGRYEEALSDLDKLRAMDRAGPDVDNMRQRIVQQMQTKQQHDADRQEDVARAASNLNAGRLESGRLAIEQIEDSHRRAELREQLDLRVQRSAQLLTQAADALNRGDVNGALRFWQETCERHGRTRDSDEFATLLAPAYRRILDDWFGAGTLERFLTCRVGIEKLQAFDPALAELGQMVVLCQRAATQLGNQDYNGLRKTLLKLRATRGKATWLKEMLAALEKITAAQDSLLASPVGLLTSSAGPPVDAATVARVATHERKQPIRSVPAQPSDPNSTPLGSASLLMLVDGTGSSLVISQDCVRIGRAGSRGAIDVPIPTDIQSHHADISRDGEDYFLSAYGPVRVNNHDVKRTLLRDGDRIVLGGKAKMVFRKPSRKSGSAVLKLSHRCRLAQDVSDVILFRETCLIGPQASCHIRMREGNTQVVLFDRGGTLYGREAAPAGGKLGDAKPLPLDETLDFGEVRVTIKPYQGNESRL